MQGATVDSGPAFPNYLDEQISLQTEVIFDSVPFFRSFGDVTTDARSSYRVVSLLAILTTIGHPKIMLCVRFSGRHCDGGISGWQSSKQSNGK
jgi:hypothetical protein